jgi:hypothetical protein
MKPAPTYIALGLSNPLEVARVGPALLIVSAPLAASMTSLKKFVAIWIKMAPSKVKNAR